MPPKRLAPLTSWSSEISFLSVEKQSNCRLNLNNLSRKTMKWNNALHLWNWWCRKKEKNESKYLRCILLGSRSLPLLFCSRLWEILDKSQENQRLFRLPTRRFCRLCWDSCFQIKFSKSCFSRKHILGASSLQNLNFKDIRRDGSSKGRSPIFPHDMSCRAFWWYLYSCLWWWMN